MHNCSLHPAVSMGGGSWRMRLLRLTAPVRFRRSSALVVMAAGATDGSALTENNVFFYDDEGRSLFEGFGVLSWNGWQERQQELLRQGVPPTPWRSARLYEGWTTYCVYNPVLRVEDYIDCARRHARDVWGRWADEKRIELRLSALSQSETNQEIRRQITSLLGQH